MLCYSIVVLLSSAVIEYPTFSIGDRFFSTRFNNRCKRPVKFIQVDAIIFTHSLHLVIKCFVDHFINFNRQRIFHKNFVLSCQVLFRADYLFTCFGNISQNGSIFLWITVTGYGIPWWSSNSHWRRQWMVLMLRGWWLVLWLKVRWRFLISPIVIEWRWWRWWCMLGRMGHI